MLVTAPYGDGLVSADSGSGEADVIIRDHRVMRLRPNDIYLFGSGEPDGVRSVLTALYR